MAGRSESFGESKHGFRLGPPLGEGELAAFEQVHGVSLPAGYRAFLTEIGNGGAGPYYGLVPLEKWRALNLSANTGSMSVFLPEFHKDDLADETKTREH